MGTDIHGWVEARTIGSGREVVDRWYGVVPIDNLVERNYDMFGMLFGVRNTSGFAPIAANRGLPQNASTEVLRDFCSEMPTYIRSKELNNIRWSEKGRQVDSRIRVSKDGKELYKAEYISILTDKNTADIDSGKSVTKNGKTYECRKMTRKECIKGARGWNTLITLITSLSEAYGTENVRLVVWFSD